MKNKEETDLVRAAVKHIEAYGDPFLTSHPSAKFSLGDPVEVTSVDGDESDVDEVCLQMEGHEYLLHELRKQNQESSVDENDILQSLEANEEDCHHKEIKIDDFADNAPSYEELMKMHFKEASLRIPAAPTLMNDSFLAQIGLSLPKVSPKFQNKPSLADIEGKRAYRFILNQSCSFADGQNIEPLSIPSAVLGAMRELAIDPKEGLFDDDFEKDSEDLSDFEQYG
eukprot:GDKJ01029388.1.p1 GENE.GDKJ01029388.1~~GDKJ01029388.1.p1  ORF type:complete len:226 (-),score=56.60 GDKJ01029388.1:385-1062(-)